jgi:hypothetical protein
LQEPDASLLQQLTGMFQRCLSDLLTSQHPGNFPVPIFFTERLDGGLRSAVGNMFGNTEMVIAEFSDLGQVRNADYLVMAGKFRQFASHHFGGAASDTGINFIKYNGFNGIGFGQNSF